MRFITPYLERHPYWGNSRNEYDAPIKKTIFDELERLNGAPEFIEHDGCKFAIVGFGVNSAENKMYFTIAKYK